MPGNGGLDMVQGAPRRREHPGHRDLQVTSDERADSEREARRGRRRRLHSQADGARTLAARVRTVMERAEHFQLELDAVIVKDSSRKVARCSTLERELIALERDPSSSETRRAVPLAPPIKRTAGLWALRVLAHWRTAAEACQRSARRPLKFTPLSPLRSCPVRLHPSVLSHLDRTGAEATPTARIIDELVGSTRDGSGRRAAPVVAAPIEANRPTPGEQRPRQRRAARLLMDLVGELVIGRNELVQLNGVEDASLIAPAAAQHDHHQLQEGITRQG